MSVCLFAFLVLYKANSIATASFNNGIAQNESCIFWNMQDYVYNFTGMTVLQYQNAKGSGVVINCKAFWHTVLDRAGTPSTP